MVESSEKQKRELRVFQEFIERSGLAIVPESLENRNPRKPDILCKVIGEDHVSYELKEVCDEVVAKETSDFLRGKNEEIPYMRLGFSLDDFMKKARNNEYDSDFPMELIFYTSGRTLYRSDQIIPKIQLYFVNDRHKFRRVWFMGDKDDTCECVFDSTEFLE